MANRTGIVAAGHLGVALARRLLVSKMLAMIHIGISFVSMCGSTGLVTCHFLLLCIVPYRLFLDNKKRFHRLKLD